MRKLNLFSRRITIILILFLATGALLFINACKKSDREMNKKELAALESRFFNEHISDAHEVQGISNYLQRLNDKDPFIEKLVGGAGFPIWDKTMMVKNYKNPAQSRGRGGSGSTVFFIPFAKDNQRVVSAALRVTITPQRDTLVKVLLASKYKDTANTGMKPHHLSLLLMKLNNAVYGQNLYKITNDAGFAAFGKNVQYVRISDHPPVNMSGRLVLWEYTLTVCYTITYPGFCDGQVHGVGPGENPYCTEYLCDSISWYEWEDDGGGGGGGGWPGDGGGGGGGNPNPCRPMPGDNNPCGGGQGSGGWEPEPIDDADLFPPCDATDRSSGASATVQYISLEPSVAQFPPFDLANNNQKEYYFLVNNVAGSHVPSAIDSLPTTGGSMQGVNSNTVMVVHTHPVGGYPFPSVADFFGLAQFTSGFMMNYVIAYDGTKYAMVVNSFSQLTHFVSNNASALGSNGFDPNSTLGIQAAAMRQRLEAQGYSHDEAYERTLAYIMKQAGVTLVKAPVGSNTFKKIGIRQKVENGNPVVDTAGNPVYENADCQ